jgi:hypothetical protein
MIDLSHAWQGTAAVVVAGAGAGIWISRLFKVIVDSRKAIKAYMQIPAAVSLFMKEVGGRLIQDPEYVAMVVAVDKALDETADVLEDLGHADEAQKLRDIIKSSGDGFTIGVSLKDIGSLIPSLKAIVTK